MPTEGTNLVSHNIVGVQEVVEQNGKVAAHIKVSAQDLSDRTIQLRTNVNNFLSGVRNC